VGTDAPPIERTRRAAAKVAAEAAADPRPIGGYAGLLAVYGAGSAALVALLRRRARGFRGLRPLDLVLYALATEHLSRLVTKDSVTAVLRFPFTRFEGTAGAGEVNEEVAAHGVGHAVGELLTCPFCIAQWIATGLVAGSLAAPALTSAVVSVSAVARLSDYLQFLWSYAEDKAG
jgi:hypothetical protein